MSHLAKPLHRFLPRKFFLKEINIKTFWFFFFFSFSFYITLIIFNYYLNKVITTFHKKKIK